VDGILKIPLDHYAEMVYIRQRNRLQFTLLPTYGGYGQVEGDGLHFLSGDESTGLIG
jgi:hypothetical protein